MDRELIRGLLLWAGIVASIVGIGVCLSMGLLLEAALYLAILLSLIGMAIATAIYNIHMRRYRP